MMYRTVTVTPTLSKSVISVTPSVTPNRITATASIINQIKTSDMPEYTGAVEVTPSNETQVLQTRNKAVLSNITINPIPSNYGLITWNGSIITVS